MANIPPVPVPYVDGAGAMMAGAWMIQWANVTENDVCLPYNGGNYECKTIDVIGTLVTSWGIQGTNDMNGTTGSFKALHDWNGNSLNAVTSLDIRRIAENPGLIRPKTPVGASSSLTFNLLIESEARR